MGLDIVKIACEELFLVPRVGISLTINKKQTIMWPKNMLQQLSSNQRLARLAKKSFRVTTRSNNNGEKNMGRNNESQVIRWQT